MTFLGDFHFIRPAWLLLVPVVAWIWWLDRQSNDPLRGWRRLMDPELLAAMTVGQRTTIHASAGNPSRWKEISSYFGAGRGLLVAWLLGVIAVAGPTWRPEPSPFADDPVPVMIVLKASETMNLSDLSPSRMERARLKVADFASQRKGQPLGLIAYAGTAHLVLPPTRDTSVVATMAAEISPAIMPKQGDDLAGALELAERTLGDSGGSVVVVADTVGEAGMGTLSASREKRQLPVFILAVARAETPEFEALSRAAASLGASLTPLTPDSADIDRLVRSTAQAPIAVASADEGTRWAEAGWWLVPILAVFVLVAFRQDRRLSPEEMAPEEMAP
jgi:Ca-activated chloride channel family protein